MSIKIHNSCRVPIDKLNKFLDEIRPIVFDKASEVAIKLMNEITIEELNEYKSKFKYEIDDSKLKFKIIIEKFEQAAKTAIRSPGIDVTFHLNIWFYNGFAYILPVCDYPFNLIEFPNWAEEFSYWNNTDQPNNISDDEWKTRRKFWDQINCGIGIHSHNSRRMCHSIIDFSSLYGDYDAETEIRRRVFANEV